MSKLKAYLMMLSILLVGLNVSAQQQTLLVHGLGKVIFQKAVSEIDSVIFSQTPSIGLTISTQHDTMYIYRSGTVIFEKEVSDIDSVYFHKTIFSTPLTVTGMLTGTTVQGCSSANAPVAATSVAQLEMMEGGINIDATCTTKDLLTVNSVDVAHGNYPIKIERIYTVRDECNNSINIVHVITIQDTTLQINIDLINIPAGTFIMGSPTTEVDRDVNEIQHKVTLSAFKMSKYSITNAQYAAFLNAKKINADGLFANGNYPTQPLIYDSSINENGYYDWGLHFAGDKWIPVQGYENLPISHVTWYGAAEFAASVCGRLPTEAEWEYACRAGTTTPFNTGNCLSNLDANYIWEFPYSTCTNTDTKYPAIAKAVGSYQPNAWGLYDMHGNGWSWCSDWFGNYSTAPQTNPSGPNIGTKRVRRGGGWHNYARYCRSAYRYSNPPYAAYSGLGFRLVFDVNQ